MPKAKPAMNMPVKDANEPVTLATITPPKLDVEEALLSALKDMDIPEAQKDIARKACEEAVAEVLDKFNYRPPDFAMTGVMDTYNIK